MKKPSLSELTLREKIGQTCVLQVRHAKGNPDYFINQPYGAIWSAYWMLSDKEVVGELVDNGYDIGAPEDFAKNYDLWLKAVNKNMKVPVLSAVDAGAGAGCDIPGCSRTPVASAIGATGSEELAYKIAKRVGTEALTAGCNWIWEPLGDIACMFNSAYVLRCFGCETEKCEKMVVSQLKGLQDAGVAATVKHFPGADIHDYRDAHIQPSEIGYSMEEWERVQAPVFQAAIDAGVYSIMIAHNSFPAADDTQINGENIPSTLSYKIITELLKEKMGFDGVVVTDGVGMRGLTVFYSGPKLYVELLKAGNDMILGPNLDDYIDEVEKAVLSGELSEERINDACQRVLNMKEKLGLFDDGYSCGGGPTEKMRLETAEISHEIFRKAQTLLVNKDNMIPLNPQKIKSVTIIYDGYSDILFDNLKYMVDEFAKYGATAEYRRSLKWGEIEKIAKENDLIVYVSYIGLHQPYGWPAYFGKDCKAFEYVLTAGKEKSIGVSFGSPFVYHDYYLGIPAFVNTYAGTKVAIEEFVKGLYGEFEFSTYNPYPIKPRM